MPNTPHVLYAAIESIDIPRILSQQGGEAVYPLPRIKALELHPKLNLAALVFAVTFHIMNHTRLASECVITKVCLYFDRI